MKPHSLLAFLVLAICPLAAADDEAKTPRFSITETSAQTTLHDRVSGASWVLVESPELHWAPVTRPEEVANGSEQAGDSATPPPGIQLTAIIRAKAGEPISTQATLSNQSQVSQDNLRVTIAPLTDGIAPAASFGAYNTGESLIWEVEHLAAGETRTFVVILQFEDAPAVQWSPIVWTVEDSAGAKKTATVEMPVKSPETFAEVLDLAEDTSTLSSDELDASAVSVAENPSVSEAVRLIRSGSLSEGSSLLVAAIEANAEHAGNGISLDGQQPLTEEALTHGREQFQKLAADRPEILRGGKSFESLHAWVIREFAGAGTGFLVDWDNSPPELPSDGTEAEHEELSEGKNAKLRIPATLTDAIGKNRSIGFEDLWHRLAFAFYHLSNTPAISELEERASNGKISRVNYVEEHFCHQHRAIQVSHKFYAIKFLPCASAAEMQSEPSRWRVTEVGWWQRPQDFINRFPFDSYPWKDYGEWYDFLSRGADADREDPLFLSSAGGNVADSSSVNEAVRLIRSGSLTDGASLLSAAIERHPEHAGNRTSLDGQNPLTEEALTHGREQFQQLAKDRPEILRGGDNFESLRAWAIREFAGASTGFLVDWDNSPPHLQANGAEAEHVGPNDRENAKIRIATTSTDEDGRSRDLEPESLWHHLVFEFYNLRGTPAFNELQERASHGQMSRVDFVEEIFGLEHRAVQITQKFYASKFLPCASTAEMQSQPSCWFVADVGWWQRPQDFINRFPFDGYPWKDYGDQYDQLVRFWQFRAVAEPQ